MSKEIDIPPPPSPEVASKAGSFLDRIDQRIKDARSDEPEGDPPVKPPVKPPVEGEDPLESIPDNEEDLVDTPLDLLDDLGGTRGGEEEEEEEEEKEKEGEGEKEKEKEKEDEEDSPEGGPAGRRIQILKGEAKVLKQSVSELESEKKALETRVEEMESQLKDYEEVRSEMDTYRKERSVLQIRQTPEYQKEVSEPIAEILGESDEVAKTYAKDGLTPAEVEEALAVSDRRERRRKIHELADRVGMEDADRETLVELGVQMAPVLARRNEILEDAEAGLRELMAAKERREEEEALVRADERKRAATAVTRRMETKIPFLSSLKGVNLKKLQDHVIEKDPSSMDMANLVYNQMAGQLFPTLVQRFMDLQEEHDVIMDELEALRTGAPGAGPGKSPSSPAGGGGTKEGGERESFLDRVPRLLTEGAS